MMSDISKLAGQIRLKMSQMTTDTTTTTDECQCHLYEWVHEYDDDSLLGDWYWCSNCEELTQVG